MKRIVVIAVIALITTAALGGTADLFQKADEYLSQGKMKEAAESYRKFAQANSEHRLAPTALFNAASIAQFELEDIPQAEAAYAEAAKKYPGAKWAAESYRRLGEIAAGRKESGEAIEYYRLALQNAKGEGYEMAEYWVNEVAQQCSECASGISIPERRVETLTVITKFIPPGETAAQAKYDLTLALKEIDQPRQAAKMAVELIYDYPRSPVVGRVMESERELVEEYAKFPWETLERIRGLESMFNRRQYSQAKEVLREILDDNPDTGFLNSVKYAEIYFSVYNDNNFASGIERMRDFIDEYPEGLPAVAARRNLEEWADIMELEDRVAENPGDPAANQEAGFMLLRRRFYDLAEKRFLKAVEATGFSDAYYGLGYVYLRTGQSEKSIESFERYLKDNPGDTRTLNIVGYNYMGMDRLEEALRCFKKYVELEPDHPNSHDSYAECLMKMEKIEEAVAEYERALELDSNWSNGVFMLGEIYLGQGNSEKAMKHYQRYLEMDPQGRVSRQAQARIDSLRAVE